MGSRFVGLSAKDVAKLRGEDTAIQSISQLRQSGFSISFSWLRTTCGHDRDVWDELGRGRSILSTNHQLDQYLYSYGPMIECQWKAIGDDIRLPTSSFRIVDYGCGQGLAGLLLLDILGAKATASVANIVLVEPSPMALVRADAIYRSVYPKRERLCINKNFDALGADEIKAANTMETVHIFSNVLDVTGFDQFKLFSKILTKGKHRIIAVSPDRESYGGNVRILSLKAAVEDPKHVGRISVTQSRFRQFRCGPGEKYPAVSWQAEIEVHDA